MKFEQSHLYHVYNQGNNREVIFPYRDNYLDFVKRTKHFIKPHADILAYCLMPNHFHFLIQATVVSIEPIQLGKIQSNRLSNGFRLLLSEYARVFNLKMERTGSLFRQKTKAIDLFERKNMDAALDCFNYIHLNPAKAGLVENARDWEYSSLKDFLGHRNGTMCNKELAFDLLGIDEHYVKEMALDF